MSNKKVIITCPTVDDVKPNITVTEAAGTETFDTMVGENQVAIIVGEPISGRFHSSHRLHTAVVDLINRFIGENRLDTDDASTPPPALTGFTVTLTPTSIATGETSQASASAPLPAGALLGTVTWTSDDLGVATVDLNTGVVSWVSAGTANIIGTSDNGGITSQATITTT